MDTPSHFPYSKSVKICLPRSLHSEFLVHSPYKAAFVRYMNATIRQNEINNTDQARTETNVSRSLAGVFPLWDAFMFIITTMSFVHRNPI